MLAATTRTDSNLAALSDEALPSVASSAQIFANAPAGTLAIVVTFRVAGVTCTFDATAATAGANGNDYEIGTYEWEMNQTAALRVRCIENGGTVTGHITYFGRA